VRDLPPRASDDSASGVAGAEIEVPYWRTTPSPTGSR
jgi:hypothetical protein